MEKELHRIFYDTNSAACYSGLNSVYREARKKFPKIKKNQVHDFLAKQEAYTLHYPVRRRFPRNKIVAAGLDSDWQADLMDLRPLKKYNDNFAYVLVCIDVLSKYAWAVPLKTKHPDTVASAFETILLKSDRKPWRLCTDRGFEFMGKPFKDFMKAEDINHFAANNPDIKASIAERYIRTLKTRIWKYFTQKGTYRYLDVLPKIVSAINNSYHRSIKCRPVDVTSENSREVWRQLYGDFRSRKAVPKFRFGVGDNVRISREKHKLEKGYRPNFSKEIFEITEQLNRRPIAYRLKDHDGEIIEGMFYEPELVKVVPPDPNVFLVEKVVKSKKCSGKLYHLVKWIGYPPSKNSWVSDDDLVTV